MGKRTSPQDLLDKVDSALAESEDVRYPVKFLLSTDLLREAREAREKWSSN